jgi:hypothetical protein
VFDTEQKLATDQDRAECQFNTGVEAAALLSAFGEEQHRSFEVVFRDRSAVGRAQQLLEDLPCGDFLMLVRI